MKLDLEKGMLGGIFLGAYTFGGAAITFLWAIIVFEILESYLETNISIITKIIILSSVLVGESVFRYKRFRKTSLELIVIKNGGVKL